MKILLINPDGLVQDGYSGPPLGLAYVAGTLVAFTKHDVRLVDGFLVGRTGIEAEVADYRPDLVGISCLTPVCKRVLEIAEHVKRQCPSCLVVLGGAHPTILWKQVLKQSKDVDICVLGEGEQTLLEIAEGRSLETIRGIAWRDQSHVRKNPHREYAEDLDTIPFPAWQLVNPRLYPARGSGVYGGIDLSAEPRGSVVFSRGCPGRCTFCSTLWIWRTHRCRSAANMADELELLHARHGMNHICFQDDAFSCNPVRVKELCREILKRRLKLAWIATTRADAVDREMVELMKSAGCYEITFGIESGSQRILNNIRKDTDLQAAQRAIALTKEAGIKATALLMVGNPGENAESINETLQFVKEARPDSCAGYCGVFVMPGTNLYQRARKEGLLTDDYWLHETRLPFYTGENSLRKLRRLHFALHHGIPYGTPGFWLRWYGPKAAAVWNRGRSALMWPLRALRGGLRRMTAHFETAFRSRKDLGKRLAWTGVGILSFIWISALVQSVATEDLDWSWGVTLHEAFARQMHWGNSLAFTYGPWGFTFMAIAHPATFIISTLVIAIWGCCFFWGAWRIARGSFAGPFWACVWLLCLFRLGSTPRESLALLTFMSLTMTYFHFGKTALESSLLAGVLGILAALALLTKFSTGIAGLFCVAMVAGDLCWRRRWPWSLLTCATALPLLWMAAGQQLSDLSGFFRNSREIASGYTEAMSSSGHFSEVAWYCATAALLLAVVIVVEVRLRRRRGLLLAAAFAFVLFLKFKHGFVRHDSYHVWYTMPALISLALLIAPFAWLQLKQGRQKWLVAAVCIVAFFSYADWRGVPQGQRVRGAAVLAYMGAGPRQAAESLGRVFEFVLHPGEIARVHEARMAQFREESPLPALAGTVDMYPPNQAVIFAHGLTYRPRPVFLSYSAYTRELEEINRRYVAGPGNPDNILFGVAPIDGRLPALEDGISWPELLTRYEPAGFTPQFLILGKRKLPLEHSLEPLAQYQIGWDQNMILALPPNEPVWAEIDLKPTLYGRLRTLMFKPDLAALAVQIKDGSDTIVRLVPAMARCGFLLSPMVRTTQQFGLLYSEAGLKQLQGHAVVSIRLTGLESHSCLWCYEDQFKLRLYRLNYPRR